MCVWGGGGGGGGGGEEEITLAVDLGTAAAHRYPWFR